MAITRGELTAEFVAEVTPLCEDYAKEMRDAGRPALSPDWRLYHTLDRHGALQVFQARNDQNKLVGFISYVTSPAVHNAKEVRAEVDAFYVHPGYRGRFLGPQLISYAETQMRPSGVTVVRQGFNLGEDYSTVMVRKGYQPVEIFYEKRL